MQQYILIENVFYIFEAFCFFPSGKDWTQVTTAVNGKISTIGVLQKGRPFTLQSLHCVAKACTHAFFLLSKTERLLPLNLRASDTDTSEVSACEPLNQQLGVSRSLFFGKTSDRCLLIWKESLLVWNVQADLVNWGVRGGWQTTPTLIKTLGLFAPQWLQEHTGTTHWGAEPGTVHSPRVSLFFCWP